jgi:hypothetical protein
MTQSTLRSVTLKTVANYTQAAERAVGAYRTGGHRLISAMQRGVDQAAKQGAERLAPRLAAALRRANSRVTGLASKGLDAVSSGTERAIELSSTGVTAQVKRVADLVEGVDNRVVVSGVQAAVRIGMPGAQAALALSERVVAGAGKLPGAKAAVIARPAKPAKRAVSARRRAVAEVEAPVKAVVKRAAAGVNKAKKAVAPVVAEVAAAAKPKAARKPAAKPAGVATQARRAAKAKVQAVSEAVESVVDAATA